MHLVHLDPEKLLTASEKQKSLEFLYFLKTFKQISYTFLKKKNIESVLKSGQISYIFLKTNFLSSLKRIQKFFISNFKNFLF